MKTLLAIKRLSVLLLAAVMVLAVLAACQNPTEDTQGSLESTPNTSVIDPDAYDSLEARLLVSDDLPDKNFDGEKFIMVSQTMHRDDLFVEEGKENGNNVIDAVYKRNLALSERFGVSFELMDFLYEDMNAYVMTCARANESPFDLLFGQAVANGYLFMEDCLMNWYDVPYVNFSKPWWSPCNVTDLTYNGYAFSVIGAVCLSALYTDSCIFYDKTLAADYGIPDMYEIVDAGTWTIDKMMSLTKDIYRDVNNDSQRDFDDFYGMALDPHGDVDAFLWSSGNRVIDMSSGEPEIVFRNQKTIDLVEKLKVLCYGTQGIYTDINYIGNYGYAEGLGKDMFAQGKAIFCATTLNSSLLYFSNIENYGIIPYPKWDENQDTYHTLVGGSHAVLSVLRCAENIEKIGLLIITIQLWTIRFTICLMTILTISVQN